MPLTITEEMIKNDPFFKKGKEEAKKEIAKKMYLDLKLPIKQIAEILEVPIEFVEKVINEKNKN